MRDPFRNLRAEFPHTFATPERIAELERERFVPWRYLPVEATAATVRNPYDSATWGGACGRGWVRDERFGSGQVIKGGGRKWGGNSSDSRKVR